MGATRSFGECTCYFYNQCGATPSFYSIYSLNLKEDLNQRASWGQTVRALFGISFLLFSEC